MTPFQQASVALAESLYDDPFYQAITAGFAHDLPARKHALEKYFHYSLVEAQRTGRCVLASDPTLGAAAWLLPRTPELEAVESAEKSEFLGEVLGAPGKRTYYRIVRFMAPLAKKAVPSGAWYLSIIGIRPSEQGRGLGASLVAGTLAEASQAKATCYLETFTPRSLRFYERLGFRRAAEHLEPTTNKPYVVMQRD